jgi:hypothetical protein
LLRVCFLSSPALHNQQASPKHGHVASSGVLVRYHWQRRRFRLAFLLLKFNERNSSIPYRKSISHSHSSHSSLQDLHNPESPFSQRIGYSHLHGLELGTDGVENWLIHILMPLSSWEGGSVQHHLRDSKPPQHPWSYALEEPLRYLCYHVSSLDFGNNSGALIFGLVQGKEWENRVCFVLNSRTAHFSHRFRLP